MLPAKGSPALGKLSPGALKGSSPALNAAVVPALRLRPEQARPRGYSSAVRCCGLVAGLLASLSAWLTSREDRRRPAWTELAIRRGLFDESFGLLYADSLELQSVAPGSPADIAGAGRFVGRVITHLDGRRLEGAEDLAEGLKGTQQILLRFSGPPMTPAPPVIAVGAKVVALKRLRFAGGGVVSRGAIGVVNKFPGEDGAWAEVSFGDAVFDATAAQVALLGTPEATAALQPPPQPRPVPQTLAVSGAGPSLDGVYAVSQGETFRGLPSWSYAARRVFSTEDGRWAVGATIGAAQVRSRLPHNRSAMPHEFEAWEIPGGPGGLLWQAAPSVSVRAAAPAPPSAPSPPPKPPKTPAPPAGCGEECPARRVACFVSGVTLALVLAKEQCGGRPCWREGAAGMALSADSEGHWALGPSHGEPTYRIAAADAPSLWPYRLPYPQWDRRLSKDGAARAGGNSWEAVRDVSCAGDWQGPPPPAALVPSDARPQRLFVETGALAAVFDLQPDGWNQKPLWRDKWGRALFHNNGGFWMLGDALGPQRNRGELRAKESIPGMPQAVGAWLRLEGAKGHRQWLDAPGVQVSAVSDGAGSAQPPLPDWPAVPPEVLPRVLVLRIPGEPPVHLTLDHRRWNGAVMWTERRAPGSAPGFRLFTNNGGFWMLGDDEGPQNNRGFLKTQLSHQGQLPHNNALRWERLGGARGGRQWRTVDAAVEGRGDSAKVKDPAAPQPPAQPPPAAPPAAAGGVAAAAGGVAAAAGDAAASAGSAAAAAGSAAAAQLPPARPPAAAASSAAVAAAAPATPAPAPPAAAGGGGRGRAPPVDDSAAVQDW